VVLEQEDRREASAILDRINELNEQGKFAQAMPEAVRLLAIVEKEKGKNHEAVGVCLNVLGGLYLSFGDDEKAEAALVRALEIYRRHRKQDSLMAATTLGLLAKLHMDRGAYREAEPFAAEALRIRERKQGEERFIVSTSLNTLGEIHLRLGAFDKAEELLLRAVELRKELGNPHGLLISLNHLATLYYVQGDTAAAAALADSALELGTYALGDRHPHLADTLDLLGRIEAADGRLESAFERLQRVQEIDLTAIDHMKGFTSEGQKLKFVRKIEEDLQVYLSLILLRMPDSSRARSSALNTLLRRKGIVLELQKRFQEALVSENEAGAVAFRELSEVRSRLTSLAFTGPGSAGPAAYRREIERLTAEKERLEAELSRISRSYSLYREAAAARCSTVAGRMGRGRALVEIVRLTPYRFEHRKGDPWDRDRYVAFVLLPERWDDVRIADLGDAGTADRLISRFKSSLFEDPGAAGETTFRYAEELYQRIFQPIEARLDGARRLFLSPEGSLNLIPFEVFRKPGGGFLIEEYTFDYLSSGRDLLAFGRAAPSGSRALLLGDPDFDAGPEDPPSRSEEPPAGGSVLPAGIRFSRLPETRREVETIRDLLGAEGAVMYTGREANESLLRAETPSARILHLATHGFFLRDTRSGADPAASGGRGIASVPVAPSGIRTANPLIRSGFALAGANRALDRPGGSDLNGVVTAEEILGLDLGKTDMVVMSACNTGMGEVQTGEGVFGLRRAFAQAGARSLVLSMWPVPDLETRELMVAFYRNIQRRDMDRCQALRQAARAQMEVARTRYGRAHPLYWGAFVFVGEP
jgi:CHAT domain-containing protein/Flp pilus assembly protein TadD